MKRNAITRFLHAARRWLWLESILQQLRTAVWVASGALILLAIVHIGWHPLPFRYGLTAAAMAGLVALAPALFSRPPLAQCAIRADRHFDGHSLVTTAHELQQASVSPTAGQTVLAQATSAVAEWMPRLGTLWRKPHGSSFAIAAVPAFFAALVLGMPANGDSAIVSLDERPGLPSDIAAGTDIFDGAGDLTRLRDSIARSGIDAPAPAQSEIAESNSDSQIPDNARPRALSESGELNTGKAPLPGVASAVNDGGSAPGDAKRRADKVEQKPDKSGPLFSGRIDKMIAREGAASAGRGDSSNEFAHQVPRSHIVRRSIVPTPSPPAPSAWTTLTAAEVAYARRYFEAAGLPDE